MLNKLRYITDIYLRKEKLLLCRGNLQCETKTMTLCIKQKKSRIHLLTKRICVKTCVIIVIRI